MSTEHAKTIARHAIQLPRVSSSPVQKRLTSARYPLTAYIWLRICDERNACVPSTVECGRHEAEEVDDMSR